MYQIQCKKEGRIRTFPPKSSLDKQYLRKNSAINNKSANVHNTNSQVTSCEKKHDCTEASKADTNALIKMDLAVNFEQMGRG